MENRKVLIITSGVYPFGTPMALRIRAFSCLFESCGWDTVVYTDQITLDNDRVETKIYENTKIYSYGKKISRIDKLVLPLVFKKRIKEIMEIERPSLIFSNCLYDRFTTIRSIADQYKLPLIIQSCEWYDPSTFKHGRLSHHYILHLFCWRFQYIHANGVVAISNLLKKHYEKNISNTIRIPTIVDEIETKYRIRVDESTKSIKLLFAGSLARTKDSIKQYFEALELMTEDYRRIQFEICGVSESDLKAHLGENIYSKYVNQITNYGRVPQDKIADMYVNCDYGIFFRPNQRSSHAGFSTKLGEGMSTGTPFIVNDTSDISLYIHNGENGFIVNDVKEIATVLDEILIMNTAQREAIRENARMTAMTSFYYEPYKEEFTSFIDCVIKEYANGKI